MNAVASLNLATHDHGVAAISNSPLALDWLSIPFSSNQLQLQTLPSTPPTQHLQLPASHLSPPTLHLQQQHQPLPQYPHLQQQQQPLYVSAPQLSSPAAPTHHSPPPPPGQSPFHQQYVTSPGRTLPGEHSFMPSAARSGPDPITTRQAAASLVRHIEPYSCREILAPCFRVASRFILGRVLGKLHVPSELGIPQIVAESCTDARFVLDLQNGSIVQMRHYPHIANLCVAFAANRAEFLSLVPSNVGRVEVTYRRDRTTSSDLEAFQLSRANIQMSWDHFCKNYDSFFPTGALSAAISSQPGQATTTFKNESIKVTVNDKYAMEFSTEYMSMKAQALARRIAPRRLLPRPSPP